MTRREAYRADNRALRAYDDGYADGYDEGFNAANNPVQQEKLRQDGRVLAAQELMDRLVEAGCRDDGWNGGDVVELLDQWLLGKGVNTTVEGNPRYARAEQEEDEGG